MLVQQSLAHVLNIDASLLQQLNETFSRIDPTKIVLGQRVPRIPDLFQHSPDGCLARWEISVSLPRDLRGNRLQFIRVRTRCLLYEVVEVHRIRTIFTVFRLPGRFSISRHAEPPGFCQSEHHVPVALSHGFDVIGHAFDGCAGH